MSDFKDFVKSKQKNVLCLTSSSDLTARIGNTLATSIFASIISRSDSEKFSEEVVKVANSDEVLNDLSEEIGVPMEAESEDDFVERAKATLAKILKRKMMN